MRYPPATSLAVPLRSMHSTAEVFVLGLRATRDKDRFLLIKKKLHFGNNSPVHIPMVCLTSFFL